MFLFGYPKQLKLTEHCPYTRWKQRQTTINRNMVVSNSWSVLFCCQVNSITNIGLWNNFLSRSKMLSVAYLSNTHSVPLHHRKDNELENKSSGNMRSVLAAYELLMFSYISTVNHLPLTSPQQCPTINNIFISFTQHFFHWTRGGNDLDGMDLIMKIEWNIIHLGR